MKFQLTSPDGKKYQVEGPDGSTPEQAYDILQQQLKSGNTRGGDLARGLAHGAMSSVGLGGYGPAEDPNPTGWRSAGENIGGVGTSLAAGLIPGGAEVKGLVGAGVGAMQPANSFTERLENAAIGGGSALVGRGVGNYFTKNRSALNALANEAIGAGTGLAHAGPFGGLGGMWAGRNIGHLVQSLVGGRGLADLVAALAKNPGLAAAMGVKLAPYAEHAGSFVGQELGKPSQ